MPSMSEAGGPDKSLLRWQEDGELYEAEERVLKAFREGWKTGEGLVVENGRMTFVVPSEGSNAPENPAEGHSADDWQGAILRAEFLRDLFLGNYGKFDPRRIMIFRAWIEGRLDLDYCEILLPLIFSQCIFSDVISLRNVIIPELQLLGCRAYRSLFAQGAKVSSSVFLFDEFKAEGEVILNGANIGRQLVCDGGHFKKGLKAQSLKTGESVLLGKEFKSNGEVILDGANIGLQLFCDGHFEKGLSAPKLKTGAHVLFSKDFKSNGGVSLAGADIGGQLYCYGGHFEKGLSAPNLKTGEGVFLGSKFKSNGEVDLNGAEISGSLDLAGATIEDRIVLNNAEVHGVLKSLEDWPGQRERLNWLRKIWFLRLWKIWLRKIWLRRNSPQQIWLRAWLPTGIHRISADGFRYRAININIEKFNWWTGLYWESYMSQSSKFSAFHSPDFSPFSPQPYEQLMSVYRRMGHTNWARKVGFALEKRRSKEFKDWQWLTWRPWYGILGLTIGYGYKPFRFVPWALGLIMAGFLLFSSGHDGIVSRYTPPSWAPLAPTFACIENKWIPSESEALESDSWMQKEKPPKDYLPFNPLVYSMEAAFPVLPLGQLEKWHPSNGFLLGVRWAWTVVGTLLLAILALFGAGVIGPRWRSGDEDG